MICNTMKYKCPNCGCIFENETDECPNCSQFFKNGNKNQNNLEGISTSPSAIASISQENESNKINLQVMLPDSQKSENGGLNKAFNFFWFIFIGLWSVIWNFFYGIGLCLTLIGIPSGIMCFKFIPVIARPAGREVLLNFSSHPVLNTLQFIFGGFVSYISCLFFSVLLRITIIGIPLGRQLYKISKFFLAPFGSKMVFINQYTDDRDTMYDLCYFLTQIYFDDKEVLLSNGKQVLASEAMRLVLSDEERANLKSKLKGSNEVDTYTLQSECVYKPNFGYIKKSFFQMFIETFFGCVAGAAAGLAIAYLLMVAFMGLFTGNFSWSLPLNFEFLEAYLDEIIVSLSIIFAVFSIIGGLSNGITVHNSKKTAKVIYPTYLKNWKAITYYYPNNVSPKQMNGRKNKNLYKEDNLQLKRYQLSRTVDDMILEILNSDKIEDNQSLGI